MEVVVFRMEKQIIHYWKFIIENMFIVKTLDFGISAWLCIPGLPFSGCEILYKLLNHFKPQL